MRVLVGSCGFSLQQTEIQRCSIMKNRTKNPPSAEDGHAPPKQQYILTETLAGVLRAIKPTGLAIPPAEQIAL